MPSIMEAVVYSSLGVIPCIGSWGQCGGEGGHWRCCPGDLYGASLRSRSLMAHWWTETIRS